jgi:hypothetical protein
MCYLCEKYAPIEGIDKYDPQIDPSITGARIIVHEGLIWYEQVPDQTLGLSVFYPGRNFN